MSLRKRNPRKSQADGSDEEDDPEALESGSDSGDGDGPNMDVDRGESENNDAPKYSSVRTYYGKNESVYIMDAKSAGNIGRYLNHSCDPNIYVQNVFVDTHDLRFPWVAFFSLKYIRAGTELTWDYRYEVGSVPGKNLKCYCGADTCRGRLL